MPAEAHAAMTYYYDHQAEIDAEIAAELLEGQVDRAAASPTPFVLRMRAKEL